MNLQIIVYSLQLLLGPKSGRTILVGGFNHVLWIPISRSAFSWLFSFFNEIDRLKPPTWTNPVRSTKVLGVLKGGLLGGRDSHICNLAFLKFKIGFPWFPPKWLMIDTLRPLRQAGHLTAGRPAVETWSAPKIHGGNGEHTLTPNLHRFTSIYISMLFLYLFLSICLYYSYE